MIVNIEAKNNFDKSEDVGTNFGNAAHYYKEKKITGEDQRRLSFVAALDNKFANAFPLALAPSETVRFNNVEFTVAIARKLGLPIPILNRYVGTFIKTEKGSPRMRVDPFGNNITTATGVKGGHVTLMHNAFSRALMTETKSVVPSCKGTNAFDTCNGVFGKCLQRQHILEEVQEMNLQRELQGVIPDGIVDATDLGNLQPFNSDPNPLAGVATLVETKTLASTAQSPDDRAEKFQHDILKKVRKLDADFPGSTFERTLKSYGNNGRYLVLVDGPFSNLSKDVGILTDLIARLRALRLLNQWDVSAKQALALNRNFLVQKFGHLSSLLWARLILSRFRDVVSRNPFPSASNTSDVFDIDNLHAYYNPNRGAFRGRNVPGA